MLKYHRCGHAKSGRSQRKRNRVVWVGLGHEAAATKSHRAQNAFSPSSKEPRVKLHDGQNSLDSRRLWNESPRNLVTGILAQVLAILILL